MSHLGISNADDDLTIAQCKRLSNWLLEDILEKAVNGPPVAVLKQELIHYGT
jgi:hypothetical protein